MTKKEEFKEFVKKNPSLINHINNNEMTWQKFYELYDMYGEDSSVWNEYTEKIDDKKNSTTLNDVINMAKNIDIDKLQDGVNSLSKAVSLFSDLFVGKGKGSGDSYKPRAIYKRFED